MIRATARNNTRSYQGELTFISTIRFGPIFPDSSLLCSRDALQDPRNAFLRWERVSDAVGHNLLWGIARDKSYQIFADAGSSLELRALTTGQEYYFAIEAFNETGSVLVEPDDHTSLDFSRGPSIGIEPRRLNQDDCVLFSRT